MLKFHIKLERNKKDYLFYNGLPVVANIAYAEIYSLTVKELQFVNDPLTKFVSCLLTKKATKLVAVLKALGKVTKLFQLASP